MIGMERNILKFGFLLNSRREQQEYLEDGKEALEFSLCIFTENTERESCDKVGCCCCYIRLVCAFLYYCFATRRLTLLGGKLGDPITVVCIVSKDQAQLIM